MAISKVPVVAGTKTLTRGSIVAGNASGEPAALAIGSNTYVLKSDGTDISWGADQAGTITAFTNGVDNRVVTATSATALNGEANLTYDGTFLGVGADADQGTGVHIKVSDSGATAWTSANQLIVEKSGDSGITLLNSTSGESFLAYGDSDNNTAGMVSYDHSDNHMGLWTGGAERSRINSAGIVMINTTSTIDDYAKFQVLGGAAIPVAVFKVGSNGETIGFRNAAGSGVGSIEINSSSTAYQTSSDYRLKENEVAISDGITRLKTLKPYRFNFIADNDENGNPTQTVDGFFAHEVTAVPEAISGTKDELEKNKDGTNKLDDDGNTIPKNQSIDQSKLVPLLVASVQELIAENETLKTRITALENA